MLKVKLNLDPTDRITFSREVSIPTPDGEPLKIQFEFKHRTRAQMAEMMDGYISKARDYAKAAAKESVPLADVVAESTRRDASAILDCAIGWNVEGYAFDAETLVKFLNLFPGAAMAVIEDYRVSLNEGRLGN